MSPEAARRWLVAIVILACVLRLALLGSRSLRRDEAWPVVLAMQESWSATIEWLPKIPCPPAFAFVLRAMYLVGGKSECWLRLIAAGFGIAAVPMLYAVARRLADRRVALLAAALLAVSGRHLYHSRDLKQYAFAAFVGTLMVLLALRIREERRPGAWIAWTVTAALSPWMAYSSMLAVGATSAVMLVWLLSERDRRGMCWWGAANAVAGLSVAALYLSVVRYQQARPDLVDHWDHMMMDFSSLGAWLEWMYEKPARVIKQFFSPIELGAVPFLIAGGVVAVRRRREGVLYWPLAMVGVALVLAAAQRFPLSTRLLLYGMPMAMLLFAAGVVAAADRLSAWRRPAGVAVLGLILAAFLGRGVWAHIVRNTDEEMRPVLRQLEAEAEPGDSLYVYSGASVAYAYYREHDFKTVIIGSSERGDADSLRKELDSAVAGGGRMWFLLTHHERRGTVDGRRVKYHDSAAMTEHLSARFRRLRTLEAPGCLAFLYDLDAGP